MQLPVMNNWHNSISSFDLAVLLLGKLALDELRELKEPIELGRDVVPDDADREQSPGLAVSESGTTFLGTSTL